MKKFDSKNTVDVDVLIANTSKFITPVWPISNFIACNPLHGFEDLKFDEALMESQNLIQKSQQNSMLQLVNCEMIKWLTAFLDMGQATIEMPNRQLGFFNVFCQMACFDRQLHSDNKDFFALIPKNAQETVLWCLSQLEITPDDYHSFLIENFSYLPGWAGYVKWLSQWNNSEEVYQKSPINLLEFMAVRLIITCILWPTAALEQHSVLQHKQVSRCLNQMHDLEKSYATYLTHQLQQQVKNNAIENDLDVQMVFCIDVRSEPFRKQLESLGAYQTLGFAGFFGLPVRIHDVDKKHFKDCCPALLKPRFDVNTILEGEVYSIESFNKKREFLASFISTYQQLKYNYATPFNLADAMGPWCGLAMLMKNCLPNLIHDAQQELKSKISHDVCETLLLDGIPQNEQLAYGKIALELMGLTKDFAKLVIFCGHGSTTTNNPYASALDCGACGGNHGADNAKILAHILNNPWVREKLSEHGIVIPKDTQFLAALHDTTTDACTIFQDREIRHADVLQKLRLDLQLVQQKNNARRLQKINHKDLKSSAIRKSLDWSEVRPEWGLARNAGFIVAPRFLTKNLDLDARCFLHSYVWQDDKQGKCLETILTAPMVVAQWINCQYLFSTLDNVNYGSGSKITHNLVGKLGVMQGNASDLMHGLSLQSVNSSDTKAYHQIQRLQVVVYAPKELVFSVIQRQEILQKLFFNQWVHILVHDPKDNEFYQLTTSKQFELLKTKEGVLA